MNLLAVAGSKPQKFIVRLGECKNRLTSCFEF